MRLRHPASLLPTFTTAGAAAPAIPLAGEASPDAPATGPLPRWKLPRDPGPVLAIGLALIFAALWTRLLLGSYLAFSAKDRDLAIYSQVLWNTAQGRPFETTSLLQNSSHLAEHVAPLLLPLTPLYALVPDISWMIVLQQFVLALAALPIFLHARRRLGGTWTPLVILLTFFLAPAVIEAARWDFHPVLLATLPIGFGGYLLLSGRTRLGALIACTTLLFDETSALALLGLGLLLLARRQRKEGAALTAIAVGWLLLMVLVVMPSFHLAATLPPVGNRTLAKFSLIQTTPAEIPGDLLARATIAGRWWLMPTAGLPFLAPQTLIATLPTAAVLLLLDDPNLMVSHRAAPMLVLIWLATVDGMAWVRPGHVRGAATGLTLGLAIASYLLWSPLPGGARYEPALTVWDGRSVALQRALELIPAQASVGASAYSAVHLANREALYFYPPEYDPALWPPQQRVEWWVFDVSRFITRPALQLASSPLRTSPSYDVWLQDDLVAVAGPSVPMPPPYPERRFGDVVALVGADVRTFPRRVRVRLAWRTLNGTTQDLVRRIEVIGGNGKVLGRSDGPYSRDYFPPSRWQPGQTVVEEVSIEVPEVQPLVKPSVRLTWFDAKTGKAIPSADRDTVVQPPGD